MIQPSCLVGSDVCLEDVGSSTALGSGDLEADEWRGECVTCSQKPYHHFPSSYYALSITTIYAENGCTFQAGKTEVKNSEMKAANDPFCTLTRYGSRLLAQHTRGDPSALRVTATLDISSEVIYK